MKLLLLFVLASVPAVIYGVCKVGETDCAKCLSVKGCAFFVVGEKGSCHKLSEKVGKLRFKATKKSQCKTVAALLGKEVKFVTGNETIIISNPANESIEQKMRPFLEATRPDETTQSTNDAVPVLQSPNSAADGIESPNSDVHELINSPDNQNAPLPNSNANEDAPSSADVHVLSSVGMRNATTINNETIVMHLFQYREDELTSFYFDCRKENRLLKRVENSLCTSFRLLERTRKQNWIVGASIIGVEYNEPVCSFLKAEKLYCKNSP